MRILLPQARRSPHLQVLVVLLATACSSLPTRNLEPIEFPKRAHLDTPSRPYEVVGEVKSRRDFDYADPAASERRICQNEFHHAVRKLVDLAEEKGADAVIEVRSVVFLLDGRIELHKTAECSDEAGSGQILARGLAVKWLPPPEAKKTQSGGRSKRLKSKKSKKN